MITYARMLGGTADHVDKNHASQGELRPDHSYCGMSDPIEAVNKRKPSQKTGDEAGKGVRV